MLMQTNKSLSAQFADVFMASIRKLFFAQTAEAEQQRG